MEIWVESIAGVVQGDGPIISATDWQYTPLMDRVGSWSFRMPAADPRASLVVPKLRVRAVIYEAGLRVELGYGIINQVDLDAGSKPEMLAVSGQDRLGELAGVSVGDLSLTKMETLTAASVDSVPLPTGGVADMPNAHDGNAATYATLTLSTGMAVRVGQTQTYHAIVFTKQTKVNTTASTWRFQYFNADVEPSGSWDPLTIISDTTIASGTKTFGQSGVITFEEPHGWGGPEYEVRIWPEDASPEIDFAEMQTISEVATTTALADLIALSDVDGGGTPDWSLDIVSGTAATLGTVYLRLNGESLLTALIKVAEATGEHFRLGTGRKIVWLQKSTPASGLTAEHGVDPIAVESNAALVVWSALTETRDANGVCSRIYPYGGGTGDKRVSLEHATYTLPVGYAYVDVGGKHAGIVRTATETWAGRIDNGRETWPEITRKAETDLQKANASNALAQKAVEWLSTHSGATAAEAPRFYSLAIVKLRAALLVGQMIRVVAQKFLDGTQYIDIDADLRVTGISYSVGGQGIVVTSLQVATVDRHPEADAVINARMIERTAANQAHTQAKELGGESYYRSGFPTEMSVLSGMVQRWETTPTGTTTGGSYTFFEPSAGGTAGTITIVKGIVTAITQGIQADQLVTVSTGYLKLDASNDPITGDLLIKPTSDSTTTFQVTPSARTTPVLSVDTTNARVGFGTAAPLRPVHISHLTDAHLHIQRASTGTGDYGEISFGNSSAERYHTAIRSIRQSNSAYGQLAFLTTTDATAYANLTERLRITHTGLVGINIVVPTEQLHIVGNLFVDTDSNKLILGAGKDMSLYYDGTSGYIKTDVVAASDMHLTTGAVKTLVLDTPVYEDIRVTPGSFDRPGSADPDIVAVTPSGSGQGTWLWEFAKSDIASFTVQIPHAYKTGQDIKVHIHWTPGDRGNEESGETVGWKIHYTWANINEAFGAMATADLSDACDGTDWKHQMTPDVVLDGHTVAKGISSMLICNVTRTDTGADDTWASGASGQLPLLLEVDFHFPIDTVGSRDWGAK